MHWHKGNKQKATCYGPTELKIFILNYHVAKCNMFSLPKLVNDFRLTRVMGKEIEALNSKHSK